jgi:cytochrome d ubiquinol oxidase subunit II
METLLPLVFMGIMGLALLLYVVLDGYDLGIGMLLPLAEDAEKDTMIAAIGPFWDANETWLVLGVGVLLIAFPEAHGLVLTSLYLPVTIMLIGLILRGVSFDFRVKAATGQRRMWNRTFAAGSAVAAVAQGWMVGSYVTGLVTTPVNVAFAALIALTLPALYLVLGSSWLLVKTEGALFTKAAHWGQRAMLPTGIGLMALSIATPLVSPTIAARWFTLPNFIGLMPIPIATAVAFVGVYAVLRKNAAAPSPSAWLAMAGTVLLCTMAAIGLAYSLYPYVVLDRLTIWEAAAAPSSLRFVFIGVAIVLPVTLGYTAFVYRVFRGKATGLSYGAEPVLADDLERGARPSS